MGCNADNREIASVCATITQPGMLTKMADLEQMALKRDRGFLVRLVLMMLVGLLAGAFLYAQLIGESATGCMARTIGGAEAGPNAAPAPP